MIKQLFDNLFWTINFTTLKVKQQKIEISKWGGRRGHNDPTILKVCIWILEEIIKYKIISNHFQQENSKSNLSLDIL